MLAMVLLTIGSVLTIGFGAWHIFVPAIWKWYSYFPSNAPELTIAVRAINIFFSISLIMFGVLMLLFTFRKPMNGFYARSMSITLAVLWAVRVVVQIVSPQGTLSALLQYGMLTAFILLFLLFASASFLIVDH
jgi:hypothetical protein